MMVYGNRTYTISVTGRDEVENFWSIPLILAAIFFLTEEKSGVRLEPCLIPETCNTPCD